MLPYRVVIQQSLPYRQFPDSFHSRVVIVGTGEVRRGVGPLVGVRGNPWFSQPIRASGFVGTGVVRRGVGPLVGVRGSFVGDNQQNLSITISTLLQTISRCVLMYRHVSAYL